MDTVKRSVLVVDDEVDICRMLERALKNECAVSSSSEPKEALEWIRAGQRYDLIISDVMMPRMNGLELLRAIAELDAAQAARLVFLTASTLPEEHEQVFRGLPNVVLRKPISVAALRAFVRERLAPQP